MPINQPNRCYKCIVANCDGIQMVQHNLPKNDAKRKEWLHALDREDLLEKSYKEVCNLKVCGAHFVLSNYRTAESFLLNRNAVPIPIKIEKAASQKSEDVAVDPPRINTGKKYKCIVKGCDLSVKPWHHLPRRKELRDKWLHNVGRNDLQEVVYSILKHKVVCGAHFDTSQYVHGSSRLLRAALPRQLQPDDPSPSENSERKDIIEDLLKDVAISTGTVTAPLLCDNKVLLKTKSTYSKHKYKMTFEDDGTSPQITDADKIKEMITTTTSENEPSQELPLETSDVFEVSDAEDDDYTSSSNVKPLTPIKSKTKYVSILKKNITNRKKRKYNEIETELEEMDVDKYDNTLLSILAEIKSLPNFLDIIFGFLYRRTDYFQTSTDQNIGIGLPDGVAQKLVWQAFKKYDDKHSEDISAPKKQQTLTEQIKPTDKIVEKSASTKPNKSEPLLFNTYNGAVFENYAWSQSITDVDIQIKIPDKITCKQLQIDVTHAQMLIKLKDTETVYLKGELCKKCKMNETVWSLGGQILQIHLEKQSESWWDCLLKTEPRLDFNKMDYPRPFEELTEKVRAIQQLSSSEINMDETVNIACEDEEVEAPFIEEYDRLIETDS